MSPRQLNQLEVTRRRLVDGVTAGCAATLMMTALVLAAPALGGGRLALRCAELMQSAKLHPLVAMAVLVAHVTYGSLAGALYTAGARRISVGSGIAYGIGLWGLAVTVYAPLCGLGFLTSHAPAIAALAIPPHLLYGAALGALSPRGEIVQPIEDRPSLDEALSI